MIIGISGKKRSGKDSFYSIIKKLLDGKHTVKRYAFADKVKEYAVNHFGIPLKDVKLEENRKLLQSIGQLFREEVSKDYWVTQVFSEIHKSRLKNPGEISVITDIRYVNEAEHVLNLDNSILIRVINKNSATFDSHQSENDLDYFNFDFTISNNGTIEDYEKEVQAWVRKNLPWIIHW